MASYAQIFDKPGFSMEKPGFSMEKTGFSMEKTGLSTRMRIDILPKIQIDRGTWIVDSHL